MSIVPVLYKERQFKVEPPSIVPGGVKNEFLLELDKNSELAKQNQNARAKQAMDTYANMMTNKRKHQREIAKTITDNVKTASEKLKGYTKFSSEMKALYDVQVNSLYASIASGVDGNAAVSKFNSAFSEPMARAFALDQVVEKQVAILDEKNKETDALGFYDISNFLADVYEGNIDPMQMDSVLFNENYFQADYEKVAYQVNKDCISGDISGKYKQEIDEIKQANYSTTIETTKIEEVLHDRCRSMYQTLVGSSLTREFNKIWTAQGNKIGQDNYDQSLSNYFERHTQMYFGDPSKLEKRGLDEAKTKEVKGFGSKGSPGGSGKKEKYALDSIPIKRDGIEDSFPDLLWQAARQSATNNELLATDPLESGGALMYDFWRYGHVTGDQSNIATSEKQFKERMNLWEEVDSFVRDGASKDPISTRTAIHDGMILYSLIELSSSGDIEFPITDPKVAANVDKIISALKDPNNKTIDEYSEAAGLSGIGNNKTRADILRVLMKHKNEVIAFDKAVSLALGDSSEGRYLSSYEGTPMNVSQPNGKASSSDVDIMIAMSALGSTARRKNDITDDRVTGDGSHMMSTSSSYGQDMRDVIDYYPGLDAGRYEYNEKMHGSTNPSSANKNQEVAIPKD